MHDACRATLGATLYRTAFTQGNVVKSAVEKSKSKSKFGDVATIVAKQVGTAADSDTA